MRAIILAAAALSVPVVTAPVHAAQLTPVLSIARSTAPVGVDVPYTIKITPAARAQGKRVRIQVRGIAAWRGFDTFRLSASGTVIDDLEGSQPGVGRYRVLVLTKDGKVIAKSSTVSVVWTSGDRP